MASVKVKFRPSTLDGKEGTLYYQVIHNRVVRQIYTDYKLFASEWDCRSEAIVGQRQGEQDYTHIIPIRHIRDG